MRPGQHNKRGRNRHRSSGGGSGSGGGGNNGGNPLSRVYESNGPDVKVRGTAQTVAEKYLQLGRDAQSAGDIVMAESYYQYAEHYLRIVSAAQAYQQQTQPQSSYHRPGDDSDDDDGDDTPETAVSESRSLPQNGEQPDLGDQPFDGDRPQPQPQGYRQQRDQPQSQGSNYNRDREQQGNSTSGGYNNNRDRNRSRWQDRRDPAPVIAPAVTAEIRPVNPPVRAEEQPREISPTATKVEAVSDSSQWEAPSFLRRPATAVTLPQPEPTAVPVEVAAPERKRTRKKPAETAETKSVEPAAD